MALYNWSTTAASNATADPSINWAEGQAPSSVNDSARAMMAVIATARKDTQAATGAGGTTSAFTFTSNQVFSSLSAMDGQLITFVAPSTNTAGATLNVDGLGAKGIYIDDASTPIPAGVLVQGTPYMVTYYSSVSQFRLWNLFANPFNIPLGGAMAYFGTTAPNSNFVFPYGQAISRSTYAALFTLFGTTYGVGDGSTTFNIPDLRGRTTFGDDNMGGSAASRLTTAGGGIDGATLGAVGGAQNVTLAANQIPSLTSVNASQAISVISTVGGIASNLTVVTDIGSGIYNGAGKNDGVPTIGQITSTGNNSISVAYTNGSQAATKTVPPAIICNYILRII